MSLIPLGSSVYKFLRRLDKTDDLKHTFRADRLNMLHLQAVLIDGPITIIVDIVAKVGRRIADANEVITRVSNLVGIFIQLVRVRCVWAIVANVADLIVVSVTLVFIGNVGTVVFDIAEAVLVAV